MLSLIAVCWSLVAGCWSLIADRRSFGIGSGSEPDAVNRHDRWIALSVASRYDAAAEFGIGIHAPALPARSARPTRRHDSSDESSDELLPLQRLRAAG
ncbi:MAG TPA: hypothetical protein VLB51_03235 [Methylomirabilota bacterium]|nr:hypothetical protein [Methylomirabilota bacterium]